MVIPKEEECLIVNTKKSFDNRIYPVIDLLNKRYSIDEYRLWASLLMLPVEANREQAYQEIEVVFQGADIVTHRGMIVLINNKLFLKPIK